MEDGGMKMQEGGHKNEERGTGRASGAFLIRAEDSRSIGRVKPAWRERWKEGCGAGLDTVTGTGAAAVAAAGT